MLAGQESRRSSRPPDLTFFGPAAGAPSSGDEATGPWSFNYLSGDQDQSLPAIAAGYYFTGYLRLLDANQDVRPRAEFEQRFRHSFPHGCASIA
jgi:hypothetical protein